MIKCSECGGELEQTADFCPNCGTKVDKSAVVKEEKTPNFVPTVVQRLMSRQKFALNAESGLQGHLSKKAHFSL